MNRVVHVVASLIGGAAEHVFALAKYADRSRYVPMLAAPDDFEPMSERFRQLGIPWFRIPIDRGLRLGAVASLSRLIREQNVDVVHCHGIRAGTYGRIAARFSHIKPGVVYTVHGFHPGHSYRGLKRFVALKWENVLANRCTDKIICVSKADALSVKSSLRLTSARDILSIVPNGVEFERFAGCQRDYEFRRSLGIADDEIALGTIGRLRPQKALDTLAPLGRILKERGWKFRILIAGEGFLEDALRQQIQECGVQEEVVLLGYREDVPQLLHAFDVFLLVSLWEGFPIVALEAMAAGVPIIATEVPGTRELVEPIYGTRLAPVRNPVALAALLEDWKENAAQWQELASHGSEMVRSHYTVETMVETTERIYDDLVQKREGKSRA